ncbi:gluconate kinase [Bacillus sp. J14TS2]|uniref:gluconokinase n=1 Tax=Bacillus sp. J14TS2 TaxID=2807188 RepID=UPI001B285994|nr:gluconokinase [Bacillus sp. J14TS2]GIN72569.1 gluconate kinase [Bacillus sp. J14TS2]
MQKEYVIGIDLGTTSVKAVLFDTKGQFVAEAERLNTFYYPSADWAEQDPDEIEESARITLKEVIEKGKIAEERLVAVGFSCAMHSLICVDERYQPLSKMIIWSDGRSNRQAEQLKKGSGKQLFLKTGAPIHPMTPFLKLLWMKETEDEAYQKAAYYISMQEYLIEKWFGERIIDYSMASATGLLNIENVAWEEEALKLVGIRREQLSKIVSPTTRLPHLKKEIADEIGVSDELPFVIGAADGQLANLGDGAISPGEVAISAGTSGAIRQFISGAAVNESEETFTYLFTKNSSIIGGATNNGGITLQWLKDLLDYKGPLEDLLHEAEAIAVGAEGLIFHPYINGERAPLWNQRAKGNFYGFTIGHKRAHLVRAVLEGIVLNLFQIGQSLEKLAGPPKKICVNGGLTKSSLWVQILADVFAQEIHLSDTPYSAAWGAAWTALVGVKKVDSFEEIKDNLPAGKVVQPNLTRHEQYKSIFKKYERLAKDLQAYFI